MLDEQPVVALAGLAVALHAHQRPLTMQALAFEQEFQAAGLQRLARGSAGQRRPVATVPELHGAAAVLAGGNRALEVSILERMILDLDRQPLLRRIERRA